MLKCYFFSNLDLQWKQTIIDSFLFYLFYQNVLEHFVHSSFSEYLKEHNLLTITQSGFGRLHSTVTSLFHVTDHWLMNIDKGLATGVVFIDL